MGGEVGRRQERQAAHGQVPDLGSDPIKGHMTILGFVGHKVSCYTTDSAVMPKPPEHGCVAIKLYFGL